MADDTRYFLITIDTEEDNAWSRGARVSTRNVGYLPRFQALCERYDLVPTYLATGTVLDDKAFRRFGREVLDRGAAEIGMHLHAWNTPPFEPITEDDAAHLTYLMEYPEAVIRSKVDHLTERLESVFGQPVKSHRAGRWGLSPTYARVLAELGYEVDCSVVPRTSFAAARGAPQGSGGPDYTGFPDEPYFLDLDNLERPGSSTLLEVPMTVVARPLPAGGVLHSIGERFELTRRLLRRVSPSTAWLRPRGRNRRLLAEAFDRVVSEGRTYAMFMLHSSELMPGGSPSFRTPESIEALYADLESLFARAAAWARGATLQQFRLQMSQGD